MSSPPPTHKHEYRFWKREKQAADTARQIAKKLNLTSEQTHDYLAMLEAH